MTDTAWQGLTTKSEGLNELHDNTELNFGRARLSTVIAQAADITLDNDFDIILLDCTAAVRTATLPAAPTAGDTYEIGKSDASGNAVTVDRNGENINGAASDGSITTQWEGKTYTYIDASIGWWER